jgi:hypothetical protein
MTRTDRSVEKWQQWIDGPISDDIVSMHPDRAAWRHINKMLSANSVLPDSCSWEFMRATYASAQAVGISA